ncbi:transcriptional regulator [Mycobacterium shinjukuense]|uniref:Transcriptional regulator n=1 Tax=Mycobacterium shinjukuense TaxID=398694 RepID=A0A7I7MTS2_9MYCO|nr:transcriptional regulator [Mycobacterium shinjukuense]MCV6986281.1 transcriptional regulator [Mycobacterium shinjukuense]ORB65354.1 transcriptional regulator [Mycobacterium shinjukuense]BBX75222.1 transcriptional regulator [Mycobacterium shinjukuense]
MTISFSCSNLRDDATSGNGDYRLDKLPETTPSTSVFDRADVNYRQFTELHGQVRDTRRKAHMAELESKTVERARCAPMHALEQLADYGFAWRDIARVVGVSVPAITKWRKGAGVTGGNRLKIARLLALIDMLSDRFIDEPASWLEMPIQDGVGITRMDLLERGRYDLVLALASTHTGDGTVEYVLNEIDPDWRETVVDNVFESYAAEDGVISIRPKQ